MRSAPTTDDAFIQKNISSLNEVWISYELGAFQAALDYRALSLNAPQFSYSAGYGDGPLWGWTGTTPSPAWFLRPPFNTAYDTTTFAAETWIQLECHSLRVAGTSYTSELYLNGALVLAHTQTLDYGAITVIELGEVRARENGNTDDVSFYRNVKIGTTRGGTDILQDDFSTGDFSKWDSAYGDVTVVNSPF